jgi:hypothetical protein
LHSEDLETELQSSAQKLERELSTIVAYVTTPLRAAETVLTVPAIDPHGDSPLDVQGRPNLATVDATFPATDILSAPSGHVDSVNPRVDLSFNTSHHASFVSPRSHGNTHAAPFVFAKLPNPVQKLLGDLPVADGLDITVLLKWLRVLVRMRNMSGGSGAFHSEILHILYGFTIGALASRTLAAIHRGDTLDVYHRDVLASSIPSTLAF